MADRSVGSHLPRQPRLRFTLGGMLFSIAVLGIGLAYFRWQRVAFGDAMLLSFAIWLVIGQSQRAGDALNRLHASTSTTRERRWGLFAQAIAPIWCIAIMLLVTACEIGARYQLITAVWRNVHDLLFFVALIGAYWELPSPHCWAMRPAPIVRTLVSLILLALGIWWTAEILRSESEIVQLVYMAIRRVEAAQPTTWNDRPFQSEPLTLSGQQLQQIQSGLFVALLLVWAAIAAAGLICLVKRLRRPWQVLLLAVWLGCLIGAGACVAACWNVGRTGLSPLHMASLYSLPWHVAVVLLVLVITVITVAALRLSVTGSSALDQDCENRNQAFLHEHPAVVAFGLCAIVAEIGPNLWINFVSLNSAPVESWIFDPVIGWRTLVVLCREYLLSAVMMPVAAMLVLGGQLWRFWRQSPRSSACWSVEPAKFVAAWIILMLTLVVAAPIAVWWGVIAAIVR